MKKIKLFMASPSDTSEEREAFVEIINSINRSRAEKEGFHLEPVEWEKYAYPEAANPQVIINELLDDAEVVVVAFWNKFGAPTEKFPSGTMEELFLALNKRKTTGSPSIKIYFRTPLPPKSVNDVEELRRIFEAKESIKDLALYKEYTTVEEFKGLLHEHINAWLSDYGGKRHPTKKDANRKISKRVLREPSDCKEVVKDVFMTVEKRYDGKKSGISFGLEDLDDAIGEIEDINLLVVAGDMASGKTSLMLALAQNTALLNRVPTLFFTTRSNERDIGSNLLCSISQINVKFLKMGFLKVEDWHKLTLAASRLAEAPLFFDDNPRMSIAEIRDQVMRLKSRHQIGLIIIDEVNYISSAKPIIGNELRLLSRDLKLPIIVTCHMKTSTRVGKRPVLNDLDSVGDLKKEADTVIFMERGEQVFSGLGRAVSRIVVAKNKNGPTMSLEKFYLPECFSFGGDVIYDT